MLALACLLATVACGARLSEEELRQADRLASAPAGQAPDPLAPNAGESQDTPETEAAPPDATATPVRPDAAAPRAASAGGTNRPVAPGTAGPGGNGGATDVGVTASQILLGNVSTLTGPVPGLFRGALVGTQAFAAYQNSVGGIHGRQLKIRAGDDRLDSGQNRTQIAALSKDVFALVGSFSVVDDGGAEEIQKSGVPDVGWSISRSRQKLANNFSPQPYAPGWRLGSLNYFKEKYGPAVIKRVAGLYSDVASARDAYNGQKAAATATGWEYVYERPLAAAESNYTSDALQIRNTNAQALFMLSDVTNIARMAKALEQQGVKLALPNYNANAYDQRFLQLAGSAAEGAVIDQQLNMYLGEDRAQVPEIDLFLTWMAKVAPRVQPDLFAAFGWASGRLFAQALAAAGPRATREGLLSELRKIDHFDANGMMAPAGPASKRPPECFIVIKVEGGRFVRHDPPRGMICDKGGFYRLPGP